MAPTQKRAKRGMSSVAAQVRTRLLLLLPPPVLVPVCACCFEKQQRWAGAVGGTGLTIAG
jgi:hypothetical protein